ncbi:rhodanese-like domain-containing protein [Streptomyces sp. P38-E01]|uniref:Rhodanese-like domain-containing protein n=1 Tax=Streptomyces tardus TaxID=2780544 RepID=A0A949N0E2_9ACTN|nr:rhodanese-like domain-containing protein [Streptomyces tardus]MBU7596585.1 rhodanese-like domain-containing protein [Streptomyces tardus]
MSASLTVAELHARAGVALVIDVRTPGEYASGHVPGACNVPLDRLDEALPVLREREAGGGSDTLAVICATGSRSANAAQRLAAAGVPAASVAGGTSQWADAGHELTRTGNATVRPRWVMDRQVRLAAGSLVVLGLLLDFVLPGARYLSLAVGAGLVLSAVTDTCGMAVALGRLPCNRAPDGGPELRETLRQLRDA